MICVISLWDKWKDKALSLTSGFWTNSMGRNEQAQPGEGWPISISAGETSLTKAILKENISAQCGSLIWVTQLLVLAQSIEWQRERNKQMVWWKVGRLLSETVLASANLQCAYNCGLCWRFLLVSGGFFALSTESLSFTFWGICTFRSLSQDRKLSSFVLKASPTWCIGSKALLGFRGHVGASYWHPELLSGPCSPLGFPGAVGPRSAAAAEAVGPMQHFHPRVLCVWMSPQGFLTVVGVGHWECPLFGLQAGAGWVTEHALLLAVTITGNLPRLFMGKARMT